MTVKALVASVAICVLLSLHLASAETNVKSNKNVRESGEPLVGKATEHHRKEDAQGARQNSKHKNNDKTGENSVVVNGKEGKKNIRNILAVLPYQGKSHHMFFRSILKILLEQGHHVTTFTTLPMEEEYSNHRQIIYKPSISSWADIFEFEKQTTQMSWEMRADLELLSESFLFPLYEFEEFRQLLAGDDHFDMVIIEPFFMQEPLVFLGHRFKCPVVGLATAITETNQDVYMGKIRNPAITAEWATCSTKPNMNFYQRAVNTFGWLVNILEHRLYYLPKRETDLHSKLNYPGMNTLPPLREMLSRISLTLSNSHQLLEYPSSIPPNLVMVPGLHITNDVSLPQEITSFIDKATNGVIIFSMGSMTPVSKMKREKEMFIDTFSKLPQLVLWKSDIDIPDLPTNIRTFKWLPQQAILAHEKCVLFITHGGMLSKQEAVYYGVPLISIPLFGDQLANTGHSQSLGMGVTLQYNNLTVDGLYSAVNEVIYNKKYVERLKEFSLIFREAVSQSRSKAQYWLNHVMDFNGAEYLRRDTLQLCWFQYFLLDVIGVFILIIIGTFTILIKCAQGLYRLRFPVKPVDIKKKQ